MREGPSKFRQAHFRCPGLLSTSSIISFKFSHFSSVPHVLILTRLLIRTLRQPKAFLTKLFALPLNPAGLPNRVAHPKLSSSLNY
jgi:hypothetical protein